jgi:hypothetical protein
MTTFTIDNDNNITAHATAAEAKALAGTERFSNEAALAKLAANWTAARLVEIHNTLTGVTPVKKFKDRNTGAARIWTAIQNLDQPAATKEAQEPASEAEPQPEASVEEAPVGEAAQPAVAPEPTPEQPATVAPDAQQTPADAPQEAPAKKKATRAKKAPVLDASGLELLGDALFHIARCLSNLKKTLVRLVVNRIGVDARPGLRLRCEDLLNGWLTHRQRRLGSSGGRPSRRTQSH